MALNSIELKWGESERELNSVNSRLKMVHIGKNIDNKSGTWRKVTFHCKYYKWHKFSHIVNSEQYMHSHNIQRIDDTLTQMEYKLVGQHIIA